MAKNKMKKFKKVKEPAAPVEETPAPVAAEEEPQEEQIAPLDPHNTTFESLSGVLDDKTLCGLKDMGMTTLREIQAMTLPQLLAGMDLAAAAKTGSGKTLAFLIPVVERLSKVKADGEKKGTRCIILSPTRELASQTQTVLTELLKYHPNLHSCLLIGGTKMTEDINKFAQGVDIIVATPGRLLDHMTRKTPCFVYKHLKVLILDEADRMLDVGFEQEMKQIISKLRKKRQTMLFSATLQSEKISDLAQMALKDDHVSVGLQHEEDVATVEGLTQGYIIVPSEMRLLVLYTLLKKFHKHKMMVFFSSCMAVKFYFELLTAIKVPVLYIHSRQKQSMRTLQYNKFVESKNGTLLCTDIAARGLDIPSVDWIIQFDPPDDPKEYIHRVGRTARHPSAQGNALIFLRPEEKGFLLYLKKNKIPLDEFTFQRSDIIDIQKQLEKLVSQLHGLNLSAIEGYTAYVRAYDSHHHKHIFDVHSLDLEKVAKSFGLPVAPSVMLSSDRGDEGMPPMKRSRNDYYQKSKRR